MHRTTRLLLLVVLAGWLTGCGVYRSAQQGISQAINGPRPTQQERAQGDTVCRCRE
jgi:hypothetical protein